MNNLWAPWRMAYIESTEPTPPCVFCAFWKEDRDRERLILKRYDGVFVIMNKFPYSNGHVMVVPYEHVDRIWKVSLSAQEELYRVTTQVAERVSEVFQVHGLNLGMNLGQAAGAGIQDHVHMHIVPRWSGDTNFMPVLGEVKVISEHIDATYDRLLRVMP